MTLVDNLVLFTFIISHVLCGKCTQNLLCKKKVIIDMRENELIKNKIKFIIVDTIRLKA